MPQLEPQARYVAGSGEFQLTRRNCAWDYAVHQIKTLQPIPRTTTELPPAARPGVRIRNETGRRDRKLRLRRGLSIHRLGIPARPQSAGDHPTFRRQNLDGASPEITEESNSPRHGRPLL